MKKQNTIIVYCLLSLLFAVSCGEAKKGAPAGEKTEEVLPEDIVEMRADQIKLAEVELGHVEQRLLSSSLKVNGTVNAAPQNLATICAPMSGFVKNTSLMPGQQVKKGEILAEIENQEFIDLQRSYLESKNKLEYAEAEYKRHNELYKEDVYSQKNVQQVTTEFKNLKAEVNALRQKLILVGLTPESLGEENIRKSIQIVAPISGYVESVNVNLGKFVSPTDIMFRIVNNNKLYLELTLFEKDANKVFRDQKVKFFINNETEEHHAVIAQTGQSVNADKSYKVYCNVLDDCKNVLPGMYVSALIATTGKMSESLPAEAVVSFDDKDYIFVYDSEKMEEGKPFTLYRMVQVRKGISEGDFTEVILPEGFKTAETRVVTKGAYNLLSAKKNAGEMAC
ncbi:MAG: efflux RND transporter periplasmic adaptor subunit [Marinilabiliales bacterium]|nr:efflux RND transporter periplasmic adaptor subunit [Marinilabiliales bacterium]